MASSSNVESKITERMDAESDCPAASQPDTQPEPGTSGAASAESTSAKASVVAGPSGVASGVAGGAKPTCLIVLGMAGSGKTSFVQRISSHLYSKKNNPYVVNLDPAVSEVPYLVNVDIRDAVKYKEVMKQYNLGPNGAIITSLNLFTTRFDQVIELISKRQGMNEFVVMDTPGQIEVFTWSASGSIITEALASQFPTVVVYVMDIARSVKPVTFMSNMLYACSILYKTKLPFIIVMNKADIIHPQFAMDWMKDFEVFGEALDSESSTYMHDLTRSLSLVLDEFYEDLKCVAFSALTGEGIDDFFVAVEGAKKQYLTEYLPEYEKLKKDLQDATLNNQAEQIKRLKLDLAKDKAKSGGMPVYSKGECVKGQKIFIGGGEMEDGNEDVDASDAEDMSDDEEEKLEYESFKKFLQKPNMKDSDNPPPN